MKKTNFKLSHIGAVVLLAAAGSANAETLTVPASVTVDNTIDFSLVGSLDFGVIRATHDASAGACAGIVVPANPASPTSSTLAASALADCAPASIGTAALIPVSGAITRPQFNIVGLAAFTELDVTVPDTAVVDPIALALNPAPAGAPVFNLYDFSVYQSSGTPGAVTLTSGVGTVSADAAGDITFSVGATITTDTTTAALAYQNTGYTGEFEVTVSY